MLPIPAPETFPDPLIGLMTDLSCVLFRRSLDPEGVIRYLWFSANVREIFGFAPQDMTVAGNGALNALHWADRDAHIAAIRQSAAQMQPCRETFRAVSADGRTRWLRGSSNPVRQDDGTIVWDGAWIDISPWMRAEHHFQTVMDHAEDAILTVDSHTGIEWVNAATEKLFGWHIEDLRGHCLIDLLDRSCPPNRPPCRNLDMLSCFERGTQEAMAKRQDGTVFPFEMTVSEVRVDGKLSLIVIGRDITRRKQTENALAEAEQRLRLTFDAAPVGIIVASSDGVIREINPAFQAMIHRAAVDLRGTPLSEIFEPGGLPAFADVPSDGDTFILDYPHHGPDSGLRLWRISGSRFAGGPGEPLAQSLLLLVEDVTDAVRSAEERRQMERVLTEAQKLEALGRLAGGVAHELNNMLGPILMAAEMVQRTAAGLSEKNASRCARIIEASKHGRDIVRSVLAYCRQERQELHPIDLVPVVQQFVELARSVLPPSIKLTPVLTTTTAPILGNAGQITQILLNLANNGRDAMNGKGELSLILSVRHQSVPSVVVTLSDTGCGMSKETLARAFDPFFTTKPVGQGTGLGLSVVQGLISAMGGTIAVSSLIGVGTTFTITLPLNDMACPEGGNGL